MFWIRNKKILCTPENPSFFFYVKVGFARVYISRTCFPDGCLIELVLIQLAGRVCQSMNCNENDVRTSNSFLKFCNSSLPVLSANSLASS